MNKTVLRLISGCTLLCYYAAHSISNFKKMHPLRVEFFHTEDIMKLIVAFEIL
jgi:hypothetical protein